MRQGMCTECFCLLVLSPPSHDMSAMTNTCMPIDDQVSGHDMNHVASLMSWNTNRVCANCHHSFLPPPNHNIWSWSLSVWCFTGEKYRVIESRELQVVHSAVSTGCRPCLPALAEAPEDDIVTTFITQGSFSCHHSECINSSEQAGNRRRW